MNDNKNTAAQPLDLDKLSANIMNLPSKNGPANREFDHWYKIGHRDARHAAVELVNEQAALIAQARASQPEGATGTTGAQQFDQDETHLNKIMRGVITDVGTHKPIDMLADPAAVAPSDAKDATVPDHSEREAANAEVHGPKTLMTDEQAFNWAWTELKKDLGAESWNAGDEVQSWAFFKYGWDHRTQLELQRYKAPATIAAGQEAANAKDAALAEFINLLADACVEYEVPDSTYEALHVSIIERAAMAAVGAAGQEGGE